LWSWCHGGGDDGGGSDGSGENDDATRAFKCLVSTGVGHPRSEKDGTMTAGAGADGSL